jgi:hypothetical protein
VRGEVNTGFWWGDLRDGAHLEAPAVGASIILKWIFKKGDGRGAMDWIDLVQDRDRWRALVNAVINLQVPQNAGHFLTSLGPVKFSRRSLLHGV